MLGLSLLFGLLSLHVGVFWDNVLFVSKTGTFLYEHGLSRWFDMPVSQYSAHPYLCGTYYALIWKLFGRSLLVSHLATIPFVFGVLYQIWKLCSYFIKTSKQQYAAFLLICTCPVLCSHCVQIGQELFILFFALYALNAILRQEQIHKAIALCFLPLFSLRAMMLCAGLFLTEWMLCTIRSRCFWTARTICSYLGGAMISIAYLMVRYGIFSDAPRAMHTGYFDYTSLIQILYTCVRNIVVFAWDYVDFGQITLFVVGAVIFIRHRDTIMQKDIRFKELFICTLLPCSLIILTSIVSLNPFGHHYFLISFLVCILMAYYLLQYSVHTSWLYTLCIVSLLAGNFIVYPEYKAQGWQNSLAHLPYWSLRRQAIQELDKLNIPLEQTASFFPNVCENDFVELNDDHRSFCEFTGENEYLFYSSCFNPTNNEITLIHNTYEPLFICKRGLVWVQVLQRKSSTP
ncbi:MAG: hypothetical protein J5761_04890 [Paludibacteraceae bacterium]|nr:hypothetical protein [Paludibacteraceae bacterium]